MPTSESASETTTALDLAGIRARLQTLQGRQFWRSLEELSGSEAFQVHREFPSQASEWTDPLTRRQFLNLMGASLALAGLVGCSAPPREKIVPYVRQPEQIVPGKPLFFATAMPLSGVATGILVESHMGRPTKIEGNPEHPASLGATDAFTQASILDLYDPDRAQAVSENGQPSSWSRAFQAMRQVREQQKATGGSGLRILTETVTSPTLGRQLLDLLKLFQQARWHQYEPGARDMVLAGARLAFGQNVNTVFRFDQANVILSLDADFLTEGPGHVRYVRDFTARRRVSGAAKPQAAMNRLYALEATPSNTGMIADHRLPLPAHQMEDFVRALAGELARQPVLTGDIRDLLARQGTPPAGNAHGKWIGALVRDLLLDKNRGRSLVIAGDRQPAIVHALVHAMNHALGNVGRTVLHTAAIEIRPEMQMDSLRALLDDMNSGNVQALVIVGGNPVYTAPADLDFASALYGLSRQQGSFTAHLGLHEDETSQLCYWHIPETHYLEAWSDARGYDGTVTIMQPLIAPLYTGAKSAHEVLTVLSDEPEKSGHDIIKDHWRREWRGGGSFDSSWQKALHDGLVAGSALPPIEVSLRQDWPATERQPRTDSSSLEVIFRFDPAVYDGRFANNGWLQELPRPLTRLTWDNAVLMSPATAERLHLGYQIGWRGGEHGQAHVDVVTLRLPGRQPIEAPIWIVPGHADNSVTVHLGHGRWRAGRVGTSTGFNAYKLWSSRAPGFELGLEMTPAHRRYPLACTQQHFLMEGRDLVRTGTPEKPGFSSHETATKTGDEKPGFLAEAHGRQPLTMYSEFAYSGYKWAMAIDLTACVGCNACVVACQAENNIPVVGKEQVLRGREMHWLRIDRYYASRDADEDPEQVLSNPTAYFQPVPCMHCENAPCEVVCPVAATVHSEEGLNDMVYNRCVGTRYCSNNCPYKVRRFNFFEYADYATESLKLLRNPDVTVRTRGVMEKCTYCVQRISAARITAEKEDRRIGDGEVLTACQAACPARAITFGDANDPTSALSRLQANPLNYTLLEELNTKPRTSYLPALRNPNPDPNLRGPASGVGSE